MRRHSSEHRLGLFALYLMVRKTQMIDRVIDLLVEQIHRINAKSKRKVIRDISREIEKVHGKERLLAEIAVASMEYPEGRICDVIYPVAGQQKLSAIVKEYRSKGALDHQIQIRMRSSYASHYRRMLPPLLSVLQFRSNNATWRPVLDGLACIEKLHKAGKRFAAEDEVPMGAIPAKWRGSVVDDKGRVNVISFELCLLTQLRERIRAKEVWVVGADRYRNPDEDLPKDFSERRETYYEELRLTRDAEAFVAEVKTTLEDELRQLNAWLPTNDKVRLRWGGKNRISVSPFEPASEPKGLIALKAEITRRWPMTGLLDALKEAALGTGYLDRFETAATREVLAPDIRDQRLLLCLYGLGTNAGLKRIAGGLADVSHDELLHIRRNYIHPAALRAACTHVADATLGIRNTAVWGEAGTACAADSTKFGAWDRNLMSEWHARYGGRGVMIYWHVERQATCIYLAVEALLLF
ncbi:Tn3 family transposase (plasmid) [Microbulbifer sp. MKSA007]|nr:Tn3 family transposase [Microbulbifer sp. MKSA007]